jgi:preprotein translocase SecE subunit
MSLIQYLKDTRGELHHVAWPTRLQTIVYTSLVIALSIFIALTGLGRGLLFLPQDTIKPSAIDISTTTDF